MEQNGQLSYFLFTFLPWDAPLGRRRLRGCSLLAQTLFPILPRLRFEKVIPESGSKAGRNPFRHFALRNATAPFCRLAATSSPGRGKSFHSGGGFGKGGKFTAYRLTSSAVGRCGRNLLVLPRARPSGELSPQATERVLPLHHSGIHTDTPCPLCRAVFLCYNDFI